MPYNAAITRADGQLSKPIILQTTNAECYKHRVDGFVMHALSVAHYFTGPLSNCLRPSLISNQGAFEATKI